MRIYHKFSEGFKSVDMEKSQVLKGRVFVDNKQVQVWEQSQNGLIKINKTFYHYSTFARTVVKIISIKVAA